MAHKVKLNNPNGCVAIWNYEDRLPADGASDKGNPNKVEPDVIINSASLISMTTNKTKSKPEGTFEIRLAPTFNWVARITAGSWCVLLMSNEKDELPSTNSFPGFVNENTFKMLGRINSVRAVISVDQISGARRTEYIVTGEDWASVFNTKLYMDPIARNNNFERLTDVGHAARFVLGNMVLDWIKSNTNLPTTSNVISAIIDLWGDPLSLLTSSLSAYSPSLVIGSGLQFEMPFPVALYMNLTSASGIPSINMASLIQLVDGKLDEYDTYSGDVEEANGFPNPRSFYGANTFWQLLVDNANTTVNELIAETRFENGRPKLALYKRIKPFINRPTLELNFETPDLVSQFKNVKRCSIPLEDVLTINAGTNWRDKINFIEILPQPNLNQVNFDVAVKTQAQEKDAESIRRDGFRPLFEPVQYMPYKGDKPAPLEVIKWKEVLREWYFNTHNMLNGAVTFMGQRKYIQVGDNIQIDASVLGSPFSQAQKNIEDRGITTYLLAHVESVSHRFTVDPNGARSFTTTVQFSRGIITYENGDPVDVLVGSAVDDKASTMNTISEKNTKSTLGTSTASDPNSQKLRGT